MPDTPRLSIVIVTFNACAQVDACLTSLAAARIALAHEIVAIDNASTDDVVAMMRSRHPHVEVVALEANVGFSRANNVGIRRSRGDLVLLLNGDTLVPPGALEALAAVLDREAAVGVVGPRLVDGRGEIELSFGPMISPWNEFRQKRRGRALRQAEPGAVAWLDRMSHRVHYPDWVSGACLMTRRAVADAVGLLDERFFLYTEDVDFCASVRAGGWRVRFAPEAEVVHLGGRSGATAPATTAAFYRRSHVAFYEKHHPRWARWLKAYLRLKSDWPPREPPAAGGAVLS